MIPISTVIVSLTALGVLIGILSGLAKLNDTWVARERKKTDAAKHEAAEAKDLAEVVKWVTDNRDRFVLALDNIERAQDAFGGPDALKLLVDTFGRELSEMRTKVQRLSEAVAVMRAQVIEAKRRDRG